jgi:hypothetical protein
MELPPSAAPLQHASRPVLDPRGPVLRPTNTNTFTASWSPSKATVLDPASLPIPKAHRAWERAEQVPQAEGSRFKKVWKRYELRVGPEETTLEAAQGECQVIEEDLDSPARVVKKLRVKSPRKRGGREADDAHDEKYHEPTRWARDRRRSGFRRMLPFLKMD